MAKGSRHPKGLYILFFTEMWERLAFYLMLGILILYCKDTERGGLAMTLRTAAEVFGTYMAFVYFTPFFGGMIADRYIGYRKAVLIGGLLMAAGLFFLGVRSEMTLYVGLSLICLGNGLFKPNISAMVGKLYAPGDPKRDAGFNIFYMGINIGAAASALLSAPLRNMYSFNTAFVAAGVGLLVGVTVLAVNWKKLAAADMRPEPTPEDVTLGKIFKVIVLPAMGFGVLGWFIGIRVDAISNSIGYITFAFLVGMLPVIFYLGMLVRNANPKEKPGMSALMPVYLAGGMFFMVLHLNGGLMTVVAENNTDRQAEWIGNVPLLKNSYSQKAMPSYFRNADPDLPRPAPETLVKVDPDVESMFGARMLDETSLNAIVAKYPDLKIVEKQVAGENASGFSGNLACKIFKDGVVSVSKGKDSHGVEVTSVTKKPETATPLRTIALVRETKGVRYSVIPVSEKTFDLVFNDASDNRLEPGESLGLVNAEMLTALFNPVFVVLFTPVLVGFFAWRVRKKKQISTPRKIFYGMIITAIALFIMAIGMYTGEDGATKISAMWIIMFYAVITFGELCLSPMGLSLVTKLAPKRLVGLMMGGWFLANAIGNKMSGFISGLVPTTKIFLVLGGLILLVAGFIFILLPRLEKAIKQYGA
ncbi:MAG: peptide MFS transporter [Myxococcota bacterium]|nr:peptide MFS transporter [Myxococcota bacterium]